MINISSDTKMRTSIIYRDENKVDEDEVDETIKLQPSNYV